MKEIKIGEQQIRVRANPLALLFYKQEFKSDLLGDMIKFEALRKDPSKLDTVAILQITWAMAKADAGLSAKFPSFEKWLEGLESFDLSDKETIDSIMQEAADGFFRSGAKRAAPTAGGKRG